MLATLVLPLFGLLSIHYTFTTLIQYIQNPFILLLCTILIILLQLTTKYYHITLISTQNISFYNTSTLYGNPTMLVKFYNIE